MKNFRILLIIALFAFALQAHAQWSNDPNVNTLVSSPGTYPEMISDGRGGAYILYWKAGDWSVQLQRLDKYGYKTMGEDGVIVAGPNLQAIAFGLSPGDSDYVVTTFLTTVGEYPNPVYNLLYAQKYDSSGSECWNTDTPICTLDSIHICLPHIAEDGYGGAFISWIDNREAASDYEVFIQHVDSEGNITYIENGMRLSTNAWDSNLNSNLLPGNDGYALAFWQDYGGFSGQRLSIDGEKLWGENGITFQTFSYSYRAFHIDNQGGTVFSDCYSIGGGMYNIFAQRIDSLGNLLWGQTGVTLEDSLPEDNQSINIALDSQWIYITWLDGEPGVYNNVKLQKLDNEGNTQWDEEGILMSNPQYMNKLPWVTISDANSIIISWYEFDTYTYYAKKLDSEATNIWIDDVIISNCQTRLTYTSSISDGAGGIINCWSVLPEILYAQQISTNGNLGEVLSVRDNNPDIPLFNQIIIENYPNPFNESTQIEINAPYDIFNSKCIIYNILGQEVRAFDLNKYNFKGKIIWDGKNDEGIPVNSGVYYFQIENDNYSKSLPIIKLK